jgi:hypothetical protein
MANSSAQSAIMIRLAQHMTDMGVRVGYRADDGDMAFSPISILGKFDGMCDSTAKEKFDAMKERYGDEVEEVCKPTVYTRVSDGKTCIDDGVTIEEVYKILLLAGGPAAKEMVDVQMRHFCGDSTLDSEIVANSISADPIKQALRERRLAKRSAA